MESDYNELAVMFGAEELVCGNCGNWCQLKGERGYGTCWKKVFDGEDIPKNAYVMLNADTSCKDAEKGFYFSPNAELIRRYEREIDYERTCRKLADDMAREAWG